MNINKDCYFCEEIEDPLSNPLKKKRIIMETTNFVAFPTVGCFQIGYLLVMPKNHYLCFGDLGSAEIKEANDIVEKLSRYILKKMNMKCIVFEHGTRNIDKLTSTSIMHAHIHIIPYAKDLISFLPDFCVLKKIRGFENLKFELDNYLYLKDTNNNHFIVLDNNYPSQFFRRIVCKSMDIPQFWDWKTHPFIENSKITIDLYKDINKF